MGAFILRLLAVVILAIGSVPAASAVGITGMPAPDARAPGDDGDDGGDGGEEDEEDDGDDGDEEGDRHLRGLVEAMPADRLGDWVVGGITVRADSSTRFDDDDEPITVGTCVSVRYRISAGASLARRIASTDAYRCDGTSPAPAREVTGILERMPDGLIGVWRIGGIDYTSDARTTVELDEGPFVIGGCVEVRVRRDASVSAIGTTEAADCGDTATREVTGTISARPVGTIGDWTVGAVTAAADAQTTLDTEDGTLAIGGCATLRWREQAGASQAVEIEAEHRWRCGDGSATNRRYGVVEAIPATTYGVWTIAGELYHVDASTRIDEDGEGPIAVGSCVRVTAAVVAGVSRAYRMHASDAGHCSGGAPDDAETQRVYATIAALPAAPYLGAWTIGALSYVANADTQFESGASYAVGDCVEAEYRVVAGTSVLTDVEPRRAARCVGGGVMRSYGTLSAMPVGGGAGDWTIGGTVVLVDGSTVLDPEHGPFVIGAWVEVHARLVAGRLTATKLETAVAPGTGGIDAVGTLDTRPADDTGSWVIGGTSYAATDDIQVALEDGARSARSAPVFVSVNAYRDAAGVLRLTQIRSGGYTLVLPALQN